MIRNNFNGTDVSMLGLGMMRLPCIENNDGLIDEAEVCRMVDYAIEHGVNYFDTAWMYHRGTGEEVSGRCLNRHKRSDFLLASKFPGQLPEVINAVEKTFETQIARCNVDFFDFYLLHNVYEQKSGLLSRRCSIRYCFLSVQAESCRQNTPSGIFHAWNAGNCKKVP